DQHEPGQREPSHLTACRGHDLGNEQRAQRSVAQELGAAHARSSSRSRGIGEASRNRTPSRLPATLIHIVSRRPIAPPRKPAISAPTSAPAAAVPRMSPIVPAVRPSVRLAKSTKIAAMKNVKKLIVLVHAMPARSTG